MRHSWRPIAAPEHNARTTFLFLFLSENGAETGSFQTPWIYLKACFFKFGHVLMRGIKKRVFVNVHQFILLYVYDYNYGDNYDSYADFHLSIWSTASALFNFLLDNPSCGPF